MKSLMSKFSKLLRSQPTPLTLMIIGLDNSGKTSILKSLVLSQRECDPFLVGPVERQPVSQQRSTDDLLGSDSSELVVGGKFDGSEDQFRVTPTAGYNYERVHYKNAKLTVLDISGQNRYRSLWQEFYDSVDGIVFVIDSSDLIRLVVVRDELELLLSHQYFASLSLASASLSTGSAHQPMGPQNRIKISQGRLIRSPLEECAGDHVISEKASNDNNRPTTSSRALSDARRRTQVPILFLANKSDLSNSIETEVIAKALNLSQLSQTRHPWFIQATSVTLNRGITDGFEWLINKLI